MILRTKEENRAAIAEQFAPHREKLGDRFDELVDEIAAVRYSYLEKREKLPTYPIGVLDSSVAEEKRLNNDQAMKCVLIKQKYGI